MRILPSHSGTSYSRSHYGLLRYSWTTRHRAGPSRAASCSRRGFVSARSKSGSVRADRGDSADWPHFKEGM